MIRIIETENQIEVYNEDTLIEKFDSLKFSVGMSSHGFIYIYDRKKSYRYVFCTGKENAFYLDMKKVTQ